MGEGDSIVELASLAEQLGDLPGKLLDLCYRHGVQVYYEYEKDMVWVNLESFLALRE